MAQETQAKHRPGALKQQNKSHKHGRHRTKGELDREFHGRVNESAKSMTKKFKAAEKRTVRRNQANQVRKQKRDAILEKKRQRGGQRTPPHFVVVVGLSGSADCSAVVEALSKTISNTDGGVVTTNEQGIVHASIARFRQRVAFYIPPAENLRSVLDAAKVADSLLFVTSPEHVIDEPGDFCLKCLMSQGVMSAVYVCQGLNDLPPKKAADARKTMLKELDRRFSVPENKIHSLDSEQDAMLVLRKLTEGKVKPVHFREVRPHIIAESISFEAESAEAEKGTLKVSGYLRGTDLSADRLLHIVGWGTYQMAQVDSATDPHPLVLQKQRAGKASSMETEEEVRVLAKPDPEKQLSLVCEAEVDPMQDEQTWPTAEELAEADASAQKEKKKKQKGVSDYQASWMFDSDFEEDEDDEDEDDEDKGEEMEAESDEDSWASCSEGDDSQSVTMTETDIGDTKYDAHFDLEAEQKLLKQRKEEREHIMFPDEVETPFDVPARERFARYRGLESFRTSPWDKDEDLPAEYQRIYRLGDIRRLKKNILKSELTNSVTMGQYITLHIKGVPKAFMECYTPGSPLVLFGLLPCEQLMSVVHFVVKRDANCRDPIKGKTRLTFQVGFRRFSACPVFSSHNKGDKHKMERFLHHEDMCVASVYAPVTFGPCPVLVFKTDSMGEEELVAAGSLLSTDPDRIVLKRLILSGDMFKMHSKKSTVRFMFFNREDIEWFKKIELRTKWRRRGRILEPVGTHGHMKCHFNGQARSQDVVMMYLYKRAYPKWTYQPEQPTQIAQVTDEEERGQAYEMFD
ncbi:pre-rRNA-processing protein TSR1 homolog [Littorina saxatilis]|uniref:Pre-rRNA-processing protein TSR1 homolog n=1 Tax=Littorina saxatilis TaxID=31220 RepID=A0AAN9BBQ8_9CAEN